MLSPDNNQSPQSRSPDPFLRPEQLPPPAQARSKPPSTRICLGTRRFGRLCVALVVTCLACLGAFYAALSPHVLPGNLRMPHAITQISPDDFTDNSKVVRSRNATSRFRDNLLSSSDHKYITAWPSSGWTNDVISAINLIYIAGLVGRTPVVPPFTPSHVGSFSEVGPIQFGAIFDVPRLANGLRMHVVEWHELKHSVLDATDPTGGGVASEVEKIGCWSPWSQNPFTRGQPRHSEVPTLYNLDISYTPVPETFTLSKGFKKDQYYMSLWSLASLSYPETRGKVLSTQSAYTIPLASGTGEKVAPDDKMLCFDLLYFIGLTDEEEWWRDYAPYWRTVGVHLHWAPKLLELAQGYLRRHFDLKDGETIPPFISVHVRRADFAGWCPPDTSPESCFATRESYAKRVHEIQASLRARPNPIDARAVLVTSDERDSAWWQKIAELGPEWRWIDHAAEKTVEKYGKWYPVILDAVFQSMGAGFVGTDRSTMTLLSQRRVEDWNGGLSAAVRWGTPSADDH
ncbi:hypothetical protein CTheo_3931 [Ceratobasidium theobromae]|uniref:O-FucT domain containing protein n=1 Tax=Ceratobasidium theobromae TaxID=1582974 RepID=A0A5N5QLF0_9AGAM|nr:hypothetical protein CTheo_3931 [Ceratobasidium theobromae]